MPTWNQPDFAKDLAKTFCQEKPLLTTKLPMTYAWLIIPGTSKLNTTAPGASTPASAPEQTFPTGGGPFSVVAADVNGDGKPDLITANTNDGTVSVLLNTTAAGPAVIMNDL